MDDSVKKVGINRIMFMSRALCPCVENIAESKKAEEELGSCVAGLCEGIRAICPHLICLQKPNMTKECIFVGRKACAKAKALVEMTS